MKADEIERFILQLCDAADECTLPHFRNGTAIDNKLAGGFDPVTAADRDAEAAIRQLIRRHYPDHGIEGEEEASVNPGAQWRWVIDPVDGTRAFICGLPTWGTLIGLYKDGLPVAGVLSQPFTGERFISSGKDAVLLHDGARTALHTRSTQRLSDAVVMTTSPFLFSADEQPRYDAVQKACRMARYGFDCYGYAMLAAGHVELVIEAGLKAYDIGALIPVIERAGGIVTTWDGASAAQGGQILAAANQALHEQAMELLGD